MTEKTRTTKDFPQAINLSFGLSVGLIDAQERQRIQLQQWHCPRMTDSLLSKQARSPVPAHGQQAIGNQITNKNRASNSCH